MNIKEFQSYFGSNLKYVISDDTIYVIDLNNLDNENADYGIINKFNKELAIKGCLTCPDVVSERLIDNATEKILNDLIDGSFYGMQITESMWEKLHTAHLGDYDLILNGYDEISVCSALREICSIIREEENIEPMNDMQLSLCAYPLSMDIKFSIVAYEETKKENEKMLSSISIFKKPKNNSGNDKTL